MDDKQKKLEQRLVESSSHRERIQAHNELSVYLRRSDLNRSLELARTATELALAGDDPAGLAAAYHNQSVCYHLMGDYQNVLNFANKALSLWVQLEDKKNHALLLRILGVAYTELGDYTQALVYQLNALEDYKILGDTTGQAGALRDIGISYSDMGDSATAISYYKRSIALHDLKSDQKQSGIIYNSCCVDYTILGDYVQARYYGEKALNAFLKVGDQYGAGVAHSSLGEVSLASHDFPAAIAAFEAARPLLESRGKNQASVEILENRVNLARAYHASGDRGRALSYAEAILSHADERNMQHLLIKCHHLLSKIHEDDGNPAAALIHLRQYIDIREAILNEKSRRDIHNLQILYETQQAQAENERQKKLREQERQNYQRIVQLKDDFFNHATHDIKNPLAVIKTATYLLKQQLKQQAIPPEERQKSEGYIQRIDEQVQKIKYLIGDMLELAKLETTPEIHIAPVALSPWFDELADTFTILAKAKQIRLTTEVEPATLVYECNKQRLGQALENMLSNALKYTPEGGQVHLKAMQTDNHIQIEISDSGIGIPPEFIPDLFNSFYRVTNHLEKVEGTGLGLTIARLGVEQHGGTIDVQSEPGKGTIFIIRLPHAE